MIPVKPLMSPAAGSGTPAPASDALGRQEFLQLLVTQLRNQDPINPMDDREFISQMAELTQLETTSRLASRLEELVAAQAETRALQLAGREIEFADKAGETLRGRVRGVRLGSSPPVLLIDDHEVPADQVQTVL